ncbi:MAG TPA: fibronectin type III domain-containing protein [Opitutaceae bacterium]|nr:fibronectin type III domain-containing protein [Opitutaceae bacterium]
MNLTASSAALRVPFPGHQPINLEFPVHFSRVLPSLVSALRPFVVLALLGGAAHLVGQVTLPYATDFEAADHFLLGPLDRQGGWEVTQGAAMVTDGAHFSGLQSVMLAPPATAIAQTFDRFASEEIVFVDFYALPVAGELAAGATRMDVESSRAEFVRVGSGGTVYAFDGDGHGGGQWVPTDFTAAVDDDGRAVDWIRFTFRQDYAEKKWDLFLNGTRVKAGLGFRDDAAGFFSRFGLLSAGATAGYLDYFYASTDNPLFVDVDKDGVEDAWQIAHGLPLGRGAWKSVPGISGQVTATLKPASGGVYRAEADAVSSVSGLKLRLQADTGVVQSSGIISTWQDQSGLGNDATQTSSGSRPTLVTNALNGYPVVHFVSSSGQYFNLPNLMSGATAGEVFMVVRATSDNDGNNHGLLQLGTNDASYYPLSDGQIRDNFGTTAAKTIGDPVIALNGYNIYNIAAQSGEWTARINGAVQYTTATNTVSFKTAPILGASGPYGFSGDVAEVIIYNHVLSSSDRDAVGAFLCTKYSLPNISIPSVPGSFTATAVSATQVNLVWTDNTPVNGAIYSIERETGGGSYSVVAEVSGSLGYFDTGLTAGTSYTYRVKARSYAGDNGYSSTASVTTKTAAPDFPVSGQRLWLRADAGVPNGAARIPTWYDQSGQNNNVTGPTTTSQQPTLVTNSVNGRPVVHFVGSSSQSFNLPNLMSGATEGEFFMVVKAASDNDGNNHGLLQLGTSDSSYYPLSNGQVRDNFGTNAFKTVGDPAAPLNQYNIYNVSSKSAEWIARFNGAVQFQTASNTVAFKTTPVLGVAGPYNFSGDIAELIIYDHVLTAVERDSVGGYLYTKYGFTGIAVPAAPASLTATAVSPTQVNLVWTDNSPTVGAVYTIERKTGAGAYSVIANVVGALGYFDSGLSANTAYTYRVLAHTYAGDNGYSGTSTVTTPVSGDDLPTSGQKLWLRADAGLPNGVGSIGSWLDQSAAGNNATSPVTTSARPTLATNVVNGRPAVHFNAANAQNFTLPNLMSGATAGEYFIVVKAASDNDGSNHGLLQLGTNDASYYPLADGEVRDNFGTNAYKTVGDPPPALDSFNLYNVSAKSAEWTARFNGVTQYQTLSNTVAFSSSPVIGIAGPYNFGGDVAELIIYDHVLQGHERAVVSAYLSQKYGLPYGTSLPPAAVTATVISSSQINLTWAGGPDDLYYTIERRVDNGSFVQIAEVSALASAYSDTSVPTGGVFKYRLRAGSIGGISDYSLAAYGLMAPGTVDSYTGLTYAQIVALGFDPLADNSSALAPSPYPPDPPPTPDPSDHTPPTLTLTAPGTATLY